MTASQILYGLERLPSTLAADDPRLPSVRLGPSPLRLHSVPLPPDAWGANMAHHATRMAAVRTWLLASCGDYNQALRRAVTHYLDAVAVHVADYRDDLAAALARFDGLYQPEDWCWSALRPMPRAWWRQDGGWQRADLAFWNGTTIIAMRASDADSSTLVPVLQHFWEGEILPVSPFRRVLPQTVISMT